MTRTTDQEIFEKGLSLKDSGDLRKALRVLSPLETRLPDAAPLLAVIGDIYWDLGEFQSAISYFQKAVCKAPTWTTASLGLFHTLWEGGRRNEALEEIKRFTLLTGSHEYDEVIREINEKS
jgi:tetratricopeptide (TPR) repeat protein